MIDVRLQIGAVLAGVGWLSLSAVAPPTAHLVHLGHHGGHD
jgi:hypothetical protein